MFKRFYHINWTADRTGDTTNIAVKKLDDEVDRIYQTISQLMHGIEGHTHSGKSDDAPRLFELWRYE